MLDLTLVVVVTSGDLPNVEKLGSKVITCDMTFDPKVTPRSAGGGGTVTEVAVEVLTRLTLVYLYTGGNY